MPSAVPIFLKMADEKQVIYFTWPNLKLLFHITTRGNQAIISHIFIFPTDSTEPLNSASQNITSLSFCITFDPPTNITQNGQITSYTVTYVGELFNTTEYNTTVSVNTTVYPLTESSSVCISNLEEYNNYTVMIRAVNGAGEGAAATIIVRTLEAGL